jgi:uncharacterized protein
MGCAGWPVSRWQRRGPETAPAVLDGGPESDCGGRVRNRKRALVLALLAACGEGAPDPGVLRQALPSTTLVISQVYGAGDTTTPAPPYRTDFIELRNLSAQPVALGGYTLQYASVMGSNWLVADFDPSAMVPASGFHLVAFSASTGSRGANLPTPDTTNALINVGRAEFKVALVTGPSALSGACPLTGADAPRIVDFVGAGTATCSEGPAAPMASVTTSLQRRGEGCLDTDRNADDFEALAPSPRNGTSFASACLPDGGSPARPDAGLATDAGALDAGAPDAGLDAGGPGDAGASGDAGRPPDAGTPDGGATPPLMARSGCRCSGVDPFTATVPAALLTLRRRRRPLT